MQALSCNIFDLSESELLQRQNKSVSLSAGISQHCSISFRVTGILMEGCQVVSCTMSLIAAGHFFLLELSFFILLKLLGEPQSL